MGSIHGDRKGDELLKAQARVWGRAFNFVHSMSTKCATELRIPDIIHSHGVKPLALSKLVAALRVPPTKAQHLLRLMRLLVHSGFFAFKKNRPRGRRRRREEGYVLTEESRLLLKDNPFSVRPLVFFGLDPSIIQSWHVLSSSFQNDQSPNDPFHFSNGLPLYDYASKEPRVYPLINESMTNDSALVARVVTSTCKQVFDGLTSMVDVAAGTGTMAKTIAEAFPHIHCTVLDLPHVVAGLEDTENVKYVAGNMFEAVPTADAVVLKWIMHNWSAEESKKILRNCKDTIPGAGKRGKVLIIEPVLGCKTLDDESLETRLLTDVLAVASVTGTQRTEKERAKLFSDAGFSSFKINPLGWRALIEVFP